MDLRSAYESEEIKEYHFHVYFYQNNDESRKSAMELREKIIKLIQDGFFHPVPNPRVNTEPRGPHLVGSYNVWCPREHFARLYSFLLLNRGNHSVLIHPLTKEEIVDHTERAAWMGHPFPVDTSNLQHILPEIPAQNKELGLGYSAPKDKRFP